MAVKMEMATAMATVMATVTATMGKGNDNDGKDDKDGKEDKGGGSGIPARHTTNN
jgi:hypothetical protein